MNFEFVTSNRIIFGNGSLSKLATLVPDFGHCALVVTGSGSVPLEKLLRIFDQENIRCEIFRVHGEPDIVTIEQGYAMSSATKCDFVIGFGGGASIDAAKAISAMMTNPGDLMEHLEVIGAGKPIKNPAAPMIALPTTAGTGTEVTRNAVIASREYRVKVSMRSPMMIPRIAIVDPELTYTMPPDVTASTGMDALTQVIEAYVSNSTNPMTDVISREGIIRGARSLLTAYQNGLDVQAREDMALTSLFGGIALANAGLGAVHGFAGPIGGMFDAPHGKVCACLLPPVMKYNAIALSHLEGGEAIKHRYQEIAAILTGKPDASIQDGVDWIAHLAKQLSISNLHSLGIEKDDFDEIIAKSMVSSSMQKNPVKLSADILRSILEEAY